MKRHAWNYDLSTKPGKDILTNRHIIPSHCPRILNTSWCIVPNMLSNPLPSHGFWGVFKIWGKRYVGDIIWMYYWSICPIYFFLDVSQHVRRKRPAIKFIYFHGNMKLGTPPVIQPGNGKSLDDYSICSKSKFWNPIWGLYRDGIVKHK